MIDAWVTKYALTAGIKAVRGVDKDGMLAVYDVGHLTQFFHGKEWHRTPEAAERRAEEMRADKIAKMRKRVAELEAMQIKAPLP